MDLHFNATYENLSAPRRGNDICVIAS